MQVNPQERTGTAEQGACDEIGGVMHSKEHPAYANSTRPDKTGNRKQGIKIKNQTGK